ncbi:MAG: FAD:protein FMN transferase [Deltaproteobacteria bacterium]|nr:FAD:protein FMN transferase [Deltaproteobacteria bacterium]
MGTVLEITLVADDRERAHATIERCFAEVERLESIFTTWRADGELARLNARAGTGPQAASPELVRILIDARGFARETEGAFDITVGPVMRLWRWAEEHGAAPSPAEIASARASVGIERVELDALRGTIALPAGAALDLGGIAKGWALDRLGELLRAEGFGRALLNFGGSSLLALGAPLDAPNWRIRLGDGSVLSLRDANVSISESLGQTFEIAGVRYGHIVDPRTSENISREQRAIVFAESGAIAEAWSTALIVLEPEAGITAAHARGGIEARVDAGARVLAETPGFQLDADGG